MSTETTLARLAEVVQPWTTAARPVGTTRLDVETAAENIVATVTALRGVRWGFLSAITGMDRAADGGAPAAGQGAAPAASPAVTGPLELLYHFCEGPFVLTLRVKLPRESPSVHTVSEVVPSALMYEREIAETFGVHIEGMKDTRRQFLSDDWPQDLYPMRKDFTSQSAAALAQAALVEPSVEPPATPGRFIVPIGPQHPALKEPGHFEMTVDGEIVTHADIRLGYVHRGIEKGAEDRSWVHNIYLMERICGICSHIHSTAYVLGVEKLAEVAVPPRAQAVRTIFCEMERIHSHLLWLGVAAHQAGFDTLFMYSWRDRETIMDLLEEISGNRVNYSVNLLGGVKYDIDAKGADALRRGMDYLEKRGHHYLKIVTTDESFLRRTRGVGAITREQALLLGTVGPTARASGVSRDLRVEAPYMAYVDFPVKTVIDTRCDLEARFIVRISELFESFRLVREMLDKMPPGDLAVPAPRRVPEGEVISRVEAPRGELFYFIRSTGGVKPDRVKVRTPSLCNWAAVLSVAVGHKLADIPMLMVGIDPCFSCNDRGVTVRRARDAGRGSAARDDAGESWTWEDLRRYGIRYYGMPAGGRDA
jgi:ech hydrogenase subunit E